MTEPTRTPPRTAPESPFLSIIVPVRADDVEALSELLTCLAAQTCPDFEAILAPSLSIPRENGRASGLDRLVSMTPGTLEPRIAVLPANAAPVHQACLASRGLYATVVEANCLLADNWVETIRQGAATAPGTIVRCRATRQLWTRDDAPVIGGTALFSVGPITLVDDDVASRCGTPSASWAFPLFTVVDLSMMPDGENNPQAQAAHLKRLCDLCGSTFVEQAPVIERTWVRQTVESTGDPESPSALRQAIPPAVMEAQRWVRRHVRRIVGR